MKSILAVRCHVLPRLPPLGSRFESHRGHYMDWVLVPTWLCGFSQGLFPWDFLPTSKKNWTFFPRLIGYYYVIQWLSSLLWEPVASQPGSMKEMKSIQDAVNTPNNAHQVLKKLLFQKACKGDWWNFDERRFQSPANGEMIWKVWHLDYTHLLIV